MLTTADPLEVEWPRVARAAMRARNQMILDNRALVYTVANRCANNCPESVEDLAQIGMIGLVKAVDRFDQSQNVAFSSFAVPYIKGAILHHLRDHWGSVKIPRRAFEEAGKVRRIQKKMAAAGRVVSEEQAAAAVGISPQRWAWIAEAVQRKQLACLDDVTEPADESEDGGRDELNQSLRNAITRLPANQRRVVTARFFRGLSVEAIARQERMPIGEVESLLAVGLAAIKTTLGGTYDDLL